MDLSDLQCMRCGQVKGKDNSLLLTDCKRILCSGCASPDGRGHLTCSLCRKKCSVDQLKSGNIPEKLRPLLRNCNDLISCFSRAHVLQNRLRDNNAEKIKQRTQKLSSKLEKMDKEATCLTFLARKAEKFLGKFERTCNGCKLTPKFRSALETFSEIDVDTGLEDFLTNFTDTSDSASTDETEDQTDTESVRDRERNRHRSKEERPERTARHNQNAKRPLDAPRLPDSPGAVRDQRPPKKLDRERLPNPKGHYASRPAAFPSASRDKPQPINPRDRGKAQADPGGPRFESNRGPDNRHFKNMAPDLHRRDPARQPAQARKPVAARDPARHPQRGTDHEPPLQRENHAKPIQRESNIPRRRKYDAAFAD